MKYYTLKEACNILGFKSYKSLNEYIKKGLPVVIVGKSKRIDEQDLQEFMNKNKQVLK
ncbi:hypothetical protein FC40_GL000712 [Ligilactobacillus hayakitensis DSM 18933 = JCM 14209]|uniref:Helix-turn-helix domain-containing protein n=1 Tax=Ligilactobacillus hayakitensis DSM 18933 = JCM 14209 TaxID=1423755 RepID=A0A0R1WSU8_9LACO|nr:helix-turn-helix domain-containing protein [Ligilactobacillus hayakitensis]KRM18923.1 hypothetical protein FC40_GL000712 [Ligilactobacillus hayakitensis DSM 18933 = JCM 14209]